MYLDDNDDDDDNNDDDDDDETQHACDIRKHAYMTKYTFVMQISAFDFDDFCYPSRYQNFDIMPVFVIFVTSACRYQEFK